MRVAVTVRQVGNEAGRGGGQGRGEEGRGEGCFVNFILCVCTSADRVDRRNLVEGGQGERRKIAWDLSAKIGRVHGGMSQPG